MQKSIRYAKIDEIKTHRLIRHEIEEYNRQLRQRQRHPFVCSPESTGEFDPGRILFIRKAVKEQTIKQGRGNLLHYLTTIFIGNIKRKFGGKADPEGKHSVRTMYCSLATRLHHSKSTTYRQVKDLVRKGLLVAKQHTGHGIEIVLNAAYLAFIPEMPQMATTTAQGADDAPVRPPMATVRQLAQELRDRFRISRTP